MPIRIVRHGPEGEEEALSATVSGDERFEALWSLSGDEVTIRSNLPTWSSVPVKGKDALVALAIFMALLCKRQGWEVDYTNAMHNVTCEANGHPQDWRRVHVEKNPFHARLEVNCPCGARREVLDGERLEAYLEKRLMKITEDGDLVASDAAYIH
jgi:hypothetical protein